MRSRVFKVALNVDREDPENRPFKRSDPLRWTRENRASILRDLYTILCWKPGAPAREKTRMKTWFRMIGHRIELLSGVDFESMISESGGADPTREGLATVVRMLKERFERACFLCPRCRPGCASSPPDDDDDEATSAREAGVDAGRGRTIPGRPANGDGREGGDRPGPLAVGQLDLATDWKTPASAGG